MQNAKETPILNHVILSVTCVEGRGERRIPGSVTAYLIRAGGPLVSTLFEWGFFIRAYPCSSLPFRMAAQRDTTAALRERYSI